MAKLKENSTILKSTGEEIIATEESVDEKLLNKADKSDIPDISDKVDKTYVDTELSKKIDATEKGNANGLAELDSSGKVLASQLPSYVDDVLEFSSLSTFPTTGETGKIYVAINTNLTYRWSGTGYVEISPSIALGETPSTAYRGDRGKIAYDHSQSTHARIDATKVESSTINGNVKINGTEVNVYTHPANHDDRYYTETEIDIKLSDKVDKVAGKGLSTNDYTDEEKQKNQDNADNISDLQQELVAHKAEKAAQDKLGHVIVDGATITIDENGVISAEAGGNVDSVNGKTGEVVIDVEDLPGLVSSKIKIGQNAIGGTGSETVVIGANTEGLGHYAVVIGSNSSAGAYAIALGRRSSASSSNSVAIGKEASVSGTDSIALGRNSSTEESSTVAIGKESASVNYREGVLGGDTAGATNKWKVPGSFTVSGTKNFEIPHPKPEKSATHVIRHGAVESPTAGDTLYRWEVQATKDNDIVLVDLPDYFIHLNKDVQIWVTGQGHFGNGYGDLNIGTEQLEIHCQFAGEYNVLVIGTRNDNHQSVQDWDIKGVEREIGESWTGETYVFSVDEILEIEEIKEVV